MRENLAAFFLRATGVPASLVFHLQLRQNNRFYVCKPRPTPYVEYPLPPVALPKELIAVAQRRCICAGPLLFRGTGGPPVPRAQRLRSRGKKSQHPTTRTPTGSTETDVARTE